MKTALILFAMCWLAILFLECVAFCCSWKSFSPFPVKVPDGRIGTVVSIPWLGNGYNTWATVNLPEPDGSREWVRYYYRDLSEASE